MSPPPVLTGERSSNLWRQRLAHWGWALLRQLNTRHDPAVVARVRELVVVLETCTHLQALDLTALARMVWAATLDAQRVLEEAEQLGDVLDVLAALEDLADTEHRGGAAAMLSNLYADQHLSAVSVVKAVRELALRWTVRDLAAHRACDDLLRFALQFGWTHAHILERTERMLNALGARPETGHAHV